MGTQDSTIAAQLLPHRVIATPAREINRRRPCRARHPPRRADACSSTSDTRVSRSGSATMRARTSYRYLSAAPHDRAYCLALARFCSGSGRGMQHGMQWTQANAGAECSEEPAHEYAYMPTRAAACATNVQCSTLHSRARAASRCRTSGVPPRLACTRPATRRRLATGATVAMSACQPAPPVEGGRRWLSGGQPPRTRWHPWLVRGPCRGRGRARPPPRTINAARRAACRLRACCHSPSRAARGSQPCNFSR
jgi:hypothetical protein